MSRVVALRRLSAPAGLTVSRLQPALEKHQREAAAAVVPWLLRAMPSSYFRYVPEGLLQDHLRAIAALYGSGTAPQLTLASSDRNVLTFISPGNFPGMLRYAAAAAAASPGARREKEAGEWGDEAAPMLSLAGGSERDRAKGEEGEESEDPRQRNALLPFSLFPLSSSLSLSQKKEGAVVACMKRPFQRNTDDCQRRTRAVGVEPGWTAVTPPSLAFSAPGASSPAPPLPNGADPPIRRRTAARRHPCLALPAAVPTREKRRETKAVSASLPRAEDDWHRVPGIPSH